ncbi:MAG TPA: PAS domain-containing protein, partial [Gaiellaceae bacterium]
LLGRSSEELVGADALSCVHPDDAARVERRLGEALDSGAAVLEHVRVRRRDGEWVQLEARLVALEDDPAQETLVLSVARDVSRTRAAEASARESRGLLEAVLGAVPDAIIVLSRSGEFVYVNRPALDLLGYADAETILRAGADEVRARFELLDEDGSPLPLERLPTRRVFAGADEAEELVRYRVLATGEERCSVVRSLPVRAADGEPELAITLFHDVTDERRGSRRLQFLAETSAALAASLDVVTALRGLDDLVVADLAEGYAVELADGGAVEGGTRTETTTTLPLVSRRRRLGTLTLFGARDSELADELARRVATAVDNARLRRETGRAAALLDTLFGTAPVGLAFLDRDLRFVRVNGALAEMNGLSEQEHVGRTPRELIPTLDPAIDERFRRVLETGEPLLDQEETGTTPARPDEERYFRVSYYPIQSDDGELLGVGVAVVETTGQKRVEAERAELLVRAQTAREEAETAAQTLRQLARVTEAALEHLGLEDLLYAVLDRLVEVLGGDTAALLLLNEEGALEVKAAIGLGSAIELAVPIQLGRGMAG